MIGHSDHRHDDLRRLPQKRIYLAAAAVSSSCCRCRKRTESVGMLPPLLLHVVVVDVAGSSDDDEVDDGVSVSHLSLRAVTGHFFCCHRRRYLQR